MSKVVALVTAVLLSSGCTVGPNYKRPAVYVPNTYRGLTPEEAAKTPSTSLGDQKWWEVFQDEQLRSLIRTSLQQNYDVRIAAARILTAQAQLGITRADQFPSVSAGAAIADARSARSAFLPAFERSTGQVNVSAVWELDFLPQKSSSQTAETFTWPVLLSKAGRKADLADRASAIAAPAETLGN